MKFFQQIEINFKTVLLISLSVLLVTLMVVLYFYFRTIAEPAISPFRLIPNNAAMIVKIKNPLELYNNHKNNSNIWNVLNKEKYFSNYFNKISQYDSLIQKNKDLEIWKENGELMISFHIDKNDSLEYFAVLPISKEIHEDEIQKLIINANANSFSFNKKAALNIAVCKKNKRISFYWCFLHRNLLISSSEKFISKSMNHEGGVAWFDSDKIFQKVYKSSGKSVDANIFINHYEFKRWFQSVFKSESFLLMNQFKDQLTWSGYDYSFKSNSFSLSGFAAASDSIPQFLNSLSKYAPTKFNISNYLPSSTFFIANYIVKPSDLLNDQHKTISILNTKFNTKICQDFLPLFDAELVKAYLNSSIFEQGIEELSIVKTNSASRLLQYYSKIGKQNNIPMDSISFLEYKIYTNPLNDFPGVLYKNACKNNYYTLISNYVVYSNSIQSLKFVLLNIKNDNVLAKSKSFMNSQDNLSASSNIFFYWNPYKHINSLEAQEEFKSYKMIASINKLLPKFDGIFLQLTKQKDLFYSNFQASIDTNISFNELYQWEYTIDTLFNSNFLVFNSTKDTKIKLIVASDVLNNIYLLNHQGKLLWKRSIDDKIFNNFNIVYSPNNKKAIILFNSASKIYAFDLDGKPLPKFPIKLAANASSAISVFNYNDNDKIRIVCPTANNTVLNFDLAARKVNGWESPKLKSCLIKPLSYISSGKTDCIYGVDKENRVLFLDRKGKIIYYGSSNAGNHVKSNIFPVILKNKEINFVGIDNNNKLIGFSTKGIVKRFANFNSINTTHLVSNNFESNSTNRIAFINADKLVLLDNEFKLDQQFNLNATEVRSLLYLSELKIIVGIINNDTVFIIDIDSERIFKASIKEIQNIWLGNFKIGQENVAHSVLLTKHKIKCLIK